jgi:CRP-like cAMP-binding protein
MKVPDHPADCSNLLLSRLPEDEYQRIRPHLEWVACPLKSSFYKRGQPIEFVHFPLGGEHSVLTVMENGSAVEVGTIGYEGFSTIEALTGNRAALEDVTCQIPGEALRMPIRSFLAAIDGKTVLRDMAYRYLYYYLAQVSQAVACNRLHTTEERFAKWLLMCHDRVPGDEIAITQEFLADMLGVHRPSVSLIARSFQQLALIRYNRGLVVILDRQGLEDASCECYATTRDRYTEVMGKSPP